MKTVINGKTFITKFRYSKHITKSGYDVLELEDQLAVAKARLECESKSVAYVHPKSNEDVLRRGQRMTSCIIKVGNEGDKTECEVFVDISTVNHPNEVFVRSEGRKTSFLKALDVMFGSPILLRLAGIVDVKLARAQFIDSFNAERNEVQIIK